MESVTQNSREWQARLDEVLKTQQEVVNKAVQEAQEEWHQVRHQLLFLCIKPRDSPKPSWFSSNKAYMILKLGHGLF